VPAKGKALLSDTQEVPVRTAGTPVPLDDFEDWEDEEDEEAARRLDAGTRRKARRLTGALALVAALGMGFAGGIVFQKHQTPATTSASGLASSFAALRAQFAGGAGAGGAPSGGATAGGGSSAFRGFAGLGGLSSNSVVGTVSAVADGTLYVSQGSSNALVKVVTGPTSTVSVSQTAPLSSVQPGDSVVVTGAKQKDGSFMAASIRDSGGTSSSTATPAG
jgi:hypothetical protein